MKYDSPLKKLSHTSNGLCMNSYQIYAMITMSYHISWLSINFIRKNIDELQIFLDRFKST